MIVITDGYSNRETNYYESDIAAARAHAGGIEMFAVGVDNADQKQLETIAGGDKNRVFNAKSFGELLAQVKQIADKICSALPADSPCGADCKGVCLCNKQCVCPTACTDVDLCLKGGCPAPGTGCIAQPKECTTEGVCAAFGTCTVSKCSPRDGECHTTQVVCDDADPCTTDSCVNGQGCKHEPIQCPRTACGLEQHCVAGTCAVKPGQATCPDRGPCFNLKCQPETQSCSYTKKLCDDNNACTTDHCAPDGTCFHQPIAGCGVCPPSNDPCRPVRWINGACTPVSLGDAGELCDDGNPCTVDTCALTAGLPSCVNTERVCPASADPLCKKTVCAADNTVPAGWSCNKQIDVKVCDDGNKCTTDTCAAGQCTFAVNCPQLPATDKCNCPSCDPLVGCVNPPKNCDDKNQCTADRCDPATGGCLHTAVACDPKDPCETTRCDPLLGCVTTPFDCSGTPAKAPCFTVKCVVVNAQPTCQQFPVAGAVDDCGRCKSANIPCFRRRSSSKLVALGVVSAVIIVSALLGGAFAIGIGLCLASKAAVGAGTASAAPAAAASVNPLYEADALSFDNPLSSQSVL